jgi:hypothetical protein
VGRPVARIKKIFSPIYIGMFSSSAVLHFTYCTLPAVLSTVSGDQISVLRSTASGKYADNFHRTELGRKFLCPRKSRNTSSQIPRRQLRENTQRISRDTGSRQSRTRPQAEAAFRDPGRERRSARPGTRGPASRDRLPRPRPREMVRKARDTGGPLVPYETASGGRLPRPRPRETVRKARDTGSR